MILTGNIDQSTDDHILTTLPAQSGGTQCREDVTRLHTPVVCCCNLDCGSALTPHPRTLEPCNSVRGSTAHTSHALAGGQRLFSRSASAAAAAVQRSPTGCVSLDVSHPFGGQTRGFDEPCIVIFWYQVEAGLGPNTQCCRSRSGAPPAPQSVSQLLPHSSQSFGTHACTETHPVWRLADRCLVSVQCGVHSLTCVSVSLAGGHLHAGGSRGVGRCRRWPPLRVAWHCHR